MKLNKIFLVIFLLNFCLKINCGWDWDNPAKIVPNNTIGSAGFGYSNRFSTNGNNLVVGGYNDNAIGAAWVYSKNGTDWDLNNPVKFIPSNNIGSSQFSYALNFLPFSKDDKNLAIGGYSDNGKGAVWVYYENVTGSYVDNPTKLVPPNLIGNSGFGYTVVFSQDNKNLAIGGFNDNSKGAIWVYGKNGADWDFNNPVKLVPSNLIGNSQFGYFISFSPDNNDLAVGGRNDNSDVGAVWIYSKNGTNWDFNNSVKLIPTNYLGTPLFGQTFMFSKDSKNLFVGGPKNNNDEGAVWVYNKIDMNWNFNNPIKLIPTNPTGNFTWFGYTLGISDDNNNLAIGGYRDDNAFISSDGKGAVWVYGKNEAEWDFSKSVKLIPKNSIGWSDFGYVLDFSPNNKNLAVGGYWDNGYKGATWIYSKNVSEIWDWDNPVKLNPTNPIGMTQFGHSLNFSPNSKNLVIGGYSDNSDKGAAWIYNYINISPAFVNNNLKVINGATTLLSPSMLQVNDTDNFYSELIFTINNLQHGKFERTNDWSQVDNFSQLDVNNIEIQFTHDNSTIAPSYSVNVTDGEFNIGPSFPNIIFSTNTTDVPVVIINPIIVDVGGAVIITTTMINGVIHGVVDPTLVFRVSNATCGYFENINNPGVHIITFTQQQVMDGQVRFVRTGAGTNCFEITVDNGIYRSRPSLVNLLSNDNSYLVPTLISVGAVVAAAIVVVIVRAVKPHLFSTEKKIKHDDEMKKKRIKKYWDNERTKDKIKKSHEEDDDGKEMENIKNV